MKLPAKIVVPVGAAVLCVVVFTGFLVWQIEGARSMLLANLPQGMTDRLASPGFMQSPEQTGDETLLHLRKGDTLGLRGEWQEAAAEYELAVKAGGGIAALRKLATAQLQRRDVRGAQVTLDQLRREGARAEDLLLLETVILLRTGEVVKAQLLLDGSAESPQKSYGLALIGIIRNDHEQAKAHLNQVIGGWEPVLRSYARIIQNAYDEYALFPQSPEIHLQTLLARALAEAQECELALPMLNAVTQSQEDYRDAWMVQGFCELSTERFAESLASFERAYSIDPEKPEIQYFLARAYIALDDHQNGLTFLQYALVNGFTPESEVRNLIAREALETGNAALALEQYDVLTQLSTAQPDVFVDYITAALTLERNEEAYIKAVQATEKWDDEALLFAQLGRAAAATDRDDEAITAFEKAIELDPGLMSAREELNKLR